MMALRLSTVLAVVSCATAHEISKGFACGVDDPVFDNYVHAEAARVEQTYHSDATRLLAADLAGRGRQLTPQNYGPFIPLHDLDAAGLAGSMRIGIVWDAVDRGDYAPSTTGGQPPSIHRGCSYVGQSIYVQDANGAEVLASSFCTADHLVTGTAGAARGQAMRDRTEAARQFWQHALKVRPVKDAYISIDSAVVDAFNITTSQVPNVDLVIIMTARPSPNRPVAGYAGCRQRDQYNRCTVGAFNWVPELLDVEHKTSPDVVSSEMHTALHEITHVLGGLNPGSAPSNSPFLNNTGAPIDPRGNVFTESYDAAYGKMVSRIVTPRVLNVSRTYFNCPTMAGFPLEDVPLGRGSHWEARLAGPEFMSYGSGSGQVYVSDLTFAYLEDTNQYIANYSMGGKLTPDEADDFSLTTLSFTQVKDSSTTYTPPPPPSPGALTWGRGQGCSFVTGNARTWPSTYTCTQNQLYGCTADNRMSAVCVINKGFTQETSCPSWYIQESDGSPACGLNNNVCSGGNCNIPTSMQFFASDAAATAAAGTTALAATTGGFSSSMDYVPVQVGYWACNTNQPVGNQTGGNEGSTSGFNNFASLFGSTSDMQMFGGQARCPQCRCFQSSLLELTRSITPTFKVYGLCYRMNCYREDYLQVAIKGQLSKSTVYWYKCPTEGGKLYIAGFSGAFHCPPAVDFCRTETITGYKYTEQSFIYEAVFWGTLAGLCVIGSLVCVCPCLRDRVILCTKRCCGALQFPTAYEEELLDNKKRVLKIKSSRYDARLEAERIASRRQARQQRAVKNAPPTDDRPSDRLPGSCASWTLFVVNILTMCVGIAMIALISYQIYRGSLLTVAIPMLGVSSLVVVVGVIGINASRKKAEAGPSCWLLTYFYLNVILSLLLLWTIAYNLSYTNWDTYVNRNWDVISDVLPAQYRTGTTREEQIASAVKAIQDNLVAVAAMAISVLVVYLTSLIAAARLLHINTLASMTVTIANNLFMVLGVLLTVVGVYLIVGKGRAAGVVSVVAVVLALGLFALVLGIVGTVAVMRKQRGLLGVYLVVITLLAAFFSYAVWLFVAQSAKINTYVNGLNDDDVAAVATDLGMSMSKAEIEAQLQDNLHQLALTAAIGIGICLILLLSGIVYFRAVSAEIAASGKHLDSVPHIDDVTKIERAATAGAGARRAMAPSPVATASPAPVAGRFAATTIKPVVATAPPATPEAPRSAGSAQAAAGFVNVTSGGAVSPAPAQSVSTAAVVPSVVPDNSSFAGANPAPGNYAALGYAPRGVPPYSVPMGYGGTPYVAPHMMPYGMGAPRPMVPGMYARPPYGYGMPSTMSAPPGGSVGGPAGVLPPAGNPSAASTGSKRGGAPPLV